MFLLMNRNVLFAVMIFMCEDQLRSLLVVTPRYLAASIVLTSLLYRQQQVIILEMVLKGDIDTWSLVLHCLEIASIRTHKYDLSLVSHCRQIEPL